MQITATITQVLAREDGIGRSSGKQWSKQAFVVSTTEQYPKTIHLTAWNDKVAIPPVGTTATFSIELESREFNGRWYTETRCWKIDYIVVQASQAEQMNNVAQLEGEDVPF